MDQYVDPLKHGIGSPTRWALTFRAARTAVLLSLLFIVVYGSTNWLTAQRPESDIRTWYFTWEPALERWVWTTFNAYQWDLDYTNPEVFRAMA